MKRPAIPLIALASVFGFLCLGACGNEDQSGTASQSNANGDAAVAATEFGIGLPAPDFTLKDMNGNEIKLSDQRGKAVVVDFWATWCGPCRAVMPHLQELSIEYAGKLEVLAVSLDQNPDSVVPEFAKKNGLTFTLLTDSRSPQVAQQWGGIRSIPTSFLVGPDGVVLHRWVGVHSREEYEMQIRKALGLES